MPTALVVFLLPLPCVLPILSPPIVWIVLHYLRESIELAIHFPLSSPPKDFVWGAFVVNFQSISDLFFFYAQVSGSRNSTSCGIYLQFYPAEDIFCSQIPPEARCICRKLVLNRSAHAIRIEWSRERGDVKICRSLTEEMPEGGDDRLRQKF